MLLSFCLIFCQFQSGVAYEIVVYKKACISPCQWKYDAFANRILKDIGMVDEGSEEETGEEKFHQSEGSQKDD